MAKPILDWWVGHSAQDEHARGKPSFTHTTIPYHTIPYHHCKPSFTHTSNHRIASLPSFQPRRCSDRTVFCDLSSKSSQNVLLYYKDSSSKLLLLYISHLVSFSLVRGVCVRATSSCLFCVISLRWNYLKPPFPTTLHLVALFCDFGWQTVFSLSRFIFKM